MGEQWVQPRAVPTEEFFPLPSPAVGISRAERRALGDQLAFGKTTPFLLLHHGEAGAGGRAA